LQRRKGGELGGKTNKARANRKVLLASREVNPLPEREKRPELIRGEVWRGDSESTQEQLNGGGSARYAG